MLKSMTLLRTILVCLALTDGIAGSAADLPHTKTDVVLTFERVVNEAGHEQAQFAITNCTARSIWFSGYDLKHPLYKVEFMHTNQWVQGFTGWCGVAAKRLELPSQKTSTFLVPLEHLGQRPQAIRVSLTCGPQKKYMEGLEKTYHSKDVVLTK